jgi:hypothetical protein
VVFALWGVASATCQLNRELCFWVVSLEKPHLANVQQTCSISGWGCYFCLSLAVVTYAPHNWFHSSTMSNTKTKPCLKIVVLGDSGYVPLGHSRQRARCMCHLTVYTLSWCMVQRGKDVPSAEVCTGPIRQLRSYHWYHATHVTSESSNYTHPPHTPQAPISVPRSC